jgi:hypothetical protein
MVIFVLTYAVLALLGLSLVGSVSTQVSKSTAKAHAPHSIDHYREMLRNAENRPPGR